MVSSLRSYNAWVGGETTVVGNPHGYHSVVILIAAAIAELAQLIRPTGDSADQSRSLIRRLFNEETVVRRAGFKCRAAAIEVWFFQVGPVVLRAESVTVAAVIAIIGKVGNLIGV